MNATLLSVMVSLAVSGTGSNTGSDTEAQKYVLPGDLVPIHYDLEFYPDMDAFEFYNIKTYSGSAVITLRAIQNNVPAVVLNCKNPLKIKGAVLLMEGKSPVNMQSTICDEETEKIAFVLPIRVQENDEFKMKISFVGEHLTQQKGFFYLPTTVGNASSFLLVTHLQPNNARMVYPCFDEPSYKALVKVSVGIPLEFYSRGFRALSNTEIESEDVDIGNNKHIFHFKTTPVPISSYLTAVAISAFVSTPPRHITSTSNKEQMEIRTWVRPELLDQAEVSQSLAQAILEIYTNDFQIDLGAIKLDQFIMNSFLNGMENWGLITYPETLVTGTSRAQAARDIAHEICHQWFGNLVTTHSWTDTWLNEGFAKYFEYFSSEKIKVPELDGSLVKFSHKFVVETLQGYGLNDDSFDYTHPLTIDAYNPRQLWCYFDHMAYDKGSSFLRMMEHVVGEKQFYKALQHYLTTNKGGVSSPEDLLSAFDFVAAESESDLQGRLPSDIFREWISQEGYPVILMSYSNSTNTLELTQESFRIGDSGKFSSYKWNIPVSYSTNLSPNFTDTRAMEWLWNDTSSTQISLSPDVEWIVLNNFETGYYRVNYHLSNWMSLLDVLQNPDTMEQIHEVNRAQIIDDAANLARSTAKEYLPYSFFMDLTTYLEHETSYYAWSSALSNFDYLYRMLSKDAKTYFFLKRHIINITRKQLKALSLLNKPGDTYQERQLRTELVTWSSKIGDAEFINEIQQLARDRTNQTLPNYVKKSASCLQVSTSDDSFSQELYEKYLNTDNVAERLSIISALSCTQNPNILNKLLQRTIDPNQNVTDSEKKLIFNSIYDARPDNAALLLIFLSKNTLQVYLNYGERKNIDIYLQRIAESLATDEELFTVRKLGYKLVRYFPMIMQCESTMPKVLNIVETNNVWLKKKREAVSQWLLSKYQSG